MWSTQLRRRQRKASAIHQHARIALPIGLLIAATTRAHEYLSAGAPSKRAAPTLSEYKSHVTEAYDYYDVILSRYFTHSLVLDVT